MIILTDISHWQDNPDTVRKIDFAKMKAAGAVGVIFKVSQATWTDKTFLAQWGEAKAAGLLRGGYHYLDWTTGGAAQAAYYWNILKADPPDLPPIVDYEQNPGSMNGVAMRSILKEWLGYFAVFVGKPVIYTSPGFWSSYGSKDLGWLDCDLWIAHYTTNAAPTIPPPWTKYALWQYTDKGNGATYGVESAQIDLNYFNGTLEDLKKWCGITPPPPPLDEHAIRLDELARMEAYIAGRRAEIV